MWRAGNGDAFGDGSDSLMLTEIAEANSSTFEQQASTGSDDDSLESEWTHYGDFEQNSSPKEKYFVPAIILFLGIIWTGLFLWGYRDIFASLPTFKENVAIFSEWCLPIAVLSVIYLIFMRSSTKEMHRFTDVSLALRTESERLETRLKTVNNELSIAREFLASETRELEFLGEKSSQKLTTAAEQIRSSLADGLTNMDKLDDVGTSAFQNLDRLREHLPVVINTAKDVTNQIGNTGRTAQSEMSAMIMTLKRIGEVGLAAKESMEAVSENAKGSVEHLERTAEAIEISLSRQLADTAAGADEIAQTMLSSANEVLNSLRQARSDLMSEGTHSTKLLRGDLESIELSLGLFRENVHTEDGRLRDLISLIEQSVEGVAARVSNLDNEGGDKTAKLAFAVTALEQNCSALQQSLHDGHGAADGMIERMERLLLALDSGARELDETIPSAFERMAEQSDNNLNLLGQIKTKIDAAASSSEGLATGLTQSDAAIKAQQLSLTEMEQQGRTSIDNLVGKLADLASALEATRNDHEELAENSGEKLISALLRVKEAAKQASEHSREAIESSIVRSADMFEKVGGEALDRILEQKVSAIAPKLEAAVEKATSSTNDAAKQLADQISIIEQMTSSLEKRISAARNSAEETNGENFTRRVAILTESLNSTAIDVTQLLSREVTDVEWAAYLKGDRGIFTRRAVRLLDTADTKEILAEYHGNSEFHEHVNRYIHDFEAMLRNILSTRDGSAVGVTLLSSDIGKLYVALAQAIERLRD